MLSASVCQQVLRAVALAMAVILTKGLGPDNDCSDDDMDDAGRTDASPR